MEDQPPTDPPAQAVDEPAAAFCYRHPDRPRAAGCARCGRPVCRRCAHWTSAGRLCVECAGQLRLSVRGGAAGPRAVTPAVGAILTANLLVFAAQWMLPGLARAFGAFPPAIAAGQWYRLVTPVFLHAGVAHLAFNSFALWIYGPGVERALGTRRFAVLYFVSGLLGGAASYAFGPCRALGVGASGAIFGVVGALLVLSFRRRASKVMGRYLQGILAIVGINLVIGFTTPGIDNVAHLGGLAGGVLAGAGLDRREGEPVPAGLPFLATAAVLALGAGLVLWRTGSFRCPGLG